MSKLERYRILQNGMQVAAVHGTDPSAFNDAMHYFSVYRQDGPVELQRRVNRRWQMVLKGTRAP